MVRLYNEDKGERYNEAGMQLDQEVSAVLRPIIEKYIALGYSVRDIQSIIESTVVCACLDKLIWPEK